MFNSKKNYVSPEVNVISVDKDIITVSGEDHGIIGGGNADYNNPTTPEVPISGDNWS